MKATDEKDLIGAEKRLIDSAGPPVIRQIGRLTDSFLRSLHALINKQTNINKLFFSLVKKIHRQFEISSAILAVYSHNDHQIKVLALKKPGYSREGLALTVPAKDSLLHRAFSDGGIRICDAAAPFPGNFIEEKLLLDNNLQSLVICPLRGGDGPVGLFCFSSPRPYRFDKADERQLDSILARLGVKVEHARERFNI